MKEMKKDENPTSMEGTGNRFLKSVRVKGYKLYDDFSIELDRYNFITGPNGSGKSAFLSIFDMLHHLAKGEFQLYVERQGGPAEILHDGPEKTKEIEIEVWFEDESTTNRDGYEVKLYLDYNQLRIKEEAVLYQDKEQTNITREVTTKCCLAESELWKWVRKNRSKKCYVYQDFLSSIVYHFCDTGWTSRIKGWVDINQVDRLWWDGGNIAAYLYDLQKTYPESYQTIVSTIKILFDELADFHLVPDERGNPPRVRLNWISQDNRIRPPEALPDGILRFICLSTLLLQPLEKMPSIVLIDEPEIGLDQSAEETLRKMLRYVSKHRTVIIATHSKELQKRPKLSEYLFG
jgi:predicted ATPase